MDAYQTSWKIIAAVQIKHNGKLATGGHSYSIAENNSLDLVDGFGKKIKKLSLGLGRFYMRTEGKRDVKNDSMFCLCNWNKLDENVAFTEMGKS